VPMDKSYNGATRGTCGKNASASRTEVNGKALVPYLSGTHKTITISPRYTVKLLVKSMSLMSLQYLEVEITAEWAPQGLNRDDTEQLSVSMSSIGLDPMVTQVALLLSDCY
jgi:hypothetical protein